MKGLEKNDSKKDIADEWSGNISKAISNYIDNEIFNNLIKKRLMKNFDPKKAIDDIRKQTEEYLIKYPKLQSFIIGMSGGIDSALVAALVKPVCNKAGIRLIGYSLPIESNKSDEIERADAIGKSLCDEFEEVDLEEVYLTILRECERYPFGLGWNLGYSDSIPGEAMRVKIKLGNIKARLRMMWLYNQAPQYNGLVLSTDNYTEYLLGYWSRFGDEGDVSPIQLYWKTEVYVMAQWLVDNEGLTVLQSAIDAVPTDGLGITDSDFDQIGMSSYTEIDNVLRHYLKTKEIIVSGEKVIERHINSEFKRHLPFFFHRQSEWI